MWITARARGGKWGGRTARSRGAGAAVPPSASAASRLAAPSQAMPMPARWRSARRGMGWASSIHMVELRRCQHGLGQPLPGSEVGGRVGSGGFALEPGDRRGQFVV
ncbi:MAG: hypothetical protein ACK56I_09705, partial [bacterium]